jgi:hypothetical protein
VTGPYAAAAERYWQAGWRGVLPLPAGKKSPPPDGWTGHGAPYPSYADIVTWIEDRGTGNLALRMPADILGIDVDAYGDKPGAATLAELEAEHGPLPATWVSTSRDDGISGIRLFQVPVGVNWISALPGIETIHAGHRYLVAAPSIHPITGRKYRWTSPAGKAADQPPGPAGLPELPLPWVVALARPYARAQASDLHQAEAVAWLGQLRGGDPCPPVALVLEQAVRQLTTAGGGARHEIARDSSRALTAFGGEGHAGVSGALGQLGHAFTAAALDPARGDNTRSADQAQAEYRDLLVGAIRLAAAANPQPAQECDCATDDDLYDLTGQQRPDQDGRQEQTTDQSAERAAADPVRPELDVTNPAVAADWLRNHLGRGHLAGMFLRGDNLVFTPREGEDGYLPLSEDDRDSDGPAQIRTVTGPGLAAQVSYRYRCVRTTITKSGNETVKPALFPQTAAQTAANAIDMMRGLRLLRGVTHTPIVRADGSILNQPGYDTHTKLLYLPGELIVPEVPESPSTEQTAAAVALLDRMVAGFPFLTRHDAANFYGLLITPMLRELVGPPYKLGVFTAPMRRSGKTLLASVLRILHGGVFRAEVPTDEAEWSKTLSTILNVTTGPVICFDNVTGTLKSGTLDGLLTSATFDARQLGRTDEMIRRRNDRIWTITSNNARLGGDLLPRALWITIDPGAPHPERRTGFTISDLPRWVNEHRGELMVALLTLVRAWVVAGQPTEQVGDIYGRWVGTIRGILTTAGVTGMFDAPESAGQEATDDEDDLSTFLDAAHHVFDDRLWTAKELLDRVDVVHAASIPLDALPGELGAKISKTGDPRMIARSLGMWLGYREGRWANNKAVRKRKANRVGTIQWQIVTYPDTCSESSAGTAGTAGTFSSPKEQNPLDDLEGGTPPGDGKPYQQSQQSQQTWPDW